MLAVLVGQRLADRRLRARARGRGACAESVRSRMRPEHLGLDVAAARAAGAVDGSRVPPAPRTRSITSFGGRAAAPQRALARQRHPLVAERDLGEPPPVVLVADDVGGGHAHVGEEHLVELVRAGHLHDRAHLDARACACRATKYVMPSCARRVGVGPRDEDAELRDVRERGPDLLAVHDVLVAVAHGSGRAATRGRCPRRAR